MALVELYNKMGLVVLPLSQFPEVNANTSQTINAAGESIAYIGQMLLSSGPGTSKTISTGKIWFQTSLGVVWATAGSTVRVGIQDVAATGLEDGTFDVFDDLVQGTDTISSSSIKEVTMSSGTKTITYGDTVAVVVEMTVRNGADSIAVTRVTLASNFPYATVDTGIGPVKNPTSTMMCVVQFDDGTIGHFGEWNIPSLVTEQAVNNGSTPDEYALAFQVPFSCTINGLFFRIGDIDAGETATVHLIEDPYGAITDLQTVSLDPNFQAQVGISEAYTMVTIPETELEPDTVYAVSYRPTSAGSRILITLTIGHADILEGLPIQITGATRTNLGAFSSSSTVFPDFGFRINKLDSGGGGGESSAAYLG